MLSRELKRAAVMTVASILLSLLSYEILLVGSYLAGVAALSFVVLVVILSSLAFHTMHASRASSPIVKLVPAEIGSATSASSGDGILFPAVAGGFAVVILFGAIVTGEVQKQVTPEMPTTRSHFEVARQTMDFAH
jgi:hypothetical protein